MKKLSISMAWDETRQVLARDGKLFTSVALALIVLPATVLALVPPPLGEEPPGWVRLLSMVVALIGLAGQLAIIRLALTSSTLVKDAIAQGFKRLLPAFVALVLFGVAMAIMAYVLVAGSTSD